MMDIYRELFERSLVEKRGLTFFVNGQTVPGLVTEILGDEAVVAYSQTYSRIIIRIDRIDAVAIG